LFCLFPETHQGCHSPHCLCIFLLKSHIASGTEGGRAVTLSQKCLKLLKGMLPTDLSLASQQGWKHSQPPAPVLSS
jgi:hypothetical protein